MKTIRDQSPEKVQNVDIKRIPYFNLNIMILIIIYKTQKQIIKQ